MNNIGYPTEFFYCLHHPSHKEYATLVIVVKIFSLIIDKDIFPLEIVVVIDKIDLHTSRLYRCHLDNQRVIGIVDNQVHSRKTNYLVQLITPLIDITVLGHKSAYLSPFFLNTLRQVPTYRGNFRIGKIRGHLLRNEQNLFCFHRAVLYKICLAKILKKISETAISPSEINSF